MVLRSLFLGVIVFFITSCSGPTIEKRVEYDANYVPDGELLFMNNCASCHGIDGKLGVSGALDLSQSTLTKKEVSTVILKGREGMPPFDYLFKDDRELDAVAEHILSLRK
ncbi:MAG: cytochrome c [Crocinitomicaceae bacterium]|nr:cytochrome c [Crocinitomicaceae bacterium]